MPVEVMDHLLAWFQLLKSGHIYLLTYYTEKRNCLCCSQHR